MNLMPSPALLKFPFICLNLLLGLRVSLSPNPPPSQDARKKFAEHTKNRATDLMTKWIWWYVPVSHLFMFAVELMEIYVIASSYLPIIRLGPFSHLVTPVNIEISKRSYVSHTFVIGTVLVVVGTNIRLAAFKYLGKQFTLECSARDDDVLITEGPYRWVRHPAYTGGVMFLNGTLIAAFGKGSWFAENGAWETTFGRVYGGITIISILAFQTFIVIRTRKEDEVLHGQFREKWEAWAKKTPYRIIPGIF